MKHAYSIVQPIRQLFRGVVVARATRLFNSSTNQTIVSWRCRCTYNTLIQQFNQSDNCFVALSLHVQHAYSTVQPIRQLFRGVVVARATHLFNSSTNQTIVSWRCRCTCNTLIFPHSTNHIIVLWRCFCTCSTIILPRSINHMIASRRRRC